MQILHQMRDATPRAMAREQIRRFIAKRRFERGEQLPTYAEFCKMLGFSLLTVQRAMGDLAQEGIVYRLHGKGCYVGKAHKVGVKAMSRVGLIHNASLNNLIEAPYLNQLLVGILGACAAREIDLTIHSLRNRDSRVSPQELTSQIDALILIGIVNPDYVRKLLKTKLPLVLVDSRLEGLPIDTVAVDNAAAVELELRTLIGLGHRRIAYVTGRTPDPLTGKSIESSDAIERREAYVSIMTGAGLADGIGILDCQGEESAQLQELLAVARSANPPTAFLTVAASLAAGLHGALTAAGIQVPEAISLAGVAGVPADVMACDLDIDYGRVDFRAMGVAAIEVLERRCGHRPPAEPQLVRIGVERVRGRSIVAPAGPPSGSDGAAPSTRGRPGRS